jgi:hypothetical protein
MMPPPPTCWTRRWRRLGDPILLRARALLYLHADDDRKAVELLAEGKDDPEARLFAAQVLAAKQPNRSNALRASIPNRCRSTCARSFSKSVPRSPSR